MSSERKEHDKQSNIIGKTAESIFWSVTVPPAMQVLRFGGTIIIARLLDPKDFGIYGLASILVFSANSLSNFGISNALIRHDNINENHVNTFFSVNLLISIMLTGLVVGFAGHIATFFNTPELSSVLKITSLIFLITSFHTIPETLLKKKLSFILINKVEIVKRLSAISFTLAFAFMGYGYWALVHGTIAANVSAAIILILKSSWLPRLGFHKKEFKEIINFASWSFVGGQLGQFTNYIDKILIGKILGPNQLGFYEKSFGFANMPLEFIANKISIVMFSTYSKVREDTDTLKYYFLRILTLNTVLCFPLLLGLFSVSEKFVIVLLGDKWLPMLPSFKILLLAYLFTSITNAFNTLNLSCGNYKKQIRARMFSLLLLLVLLLILTELGIKYVAFAVLIHNIILLVFTYNVAKQVMPLPIGKIFTTVKPALYPSILMILAIHILSKFFFLKNNILNLLSLVLIGALIYIFCILFIDNEETRFIRKKTNSFFKEIIHNKNL